MLNFTSPGSAPSTPATPGTYQLCRNVNGRNWSWQYFLKFSEQHPEMKNFVQCTLCKRDKPDEPELRWNIQYDQSAGKLERHIQRNHAVEWGANDKKVQSEKLGLQSGIKKFTVNAPPNVLSAYIRWVVHTYQPLDGCNDPFFRAFCKALKPTAEIWDRNKILTSIMSASTRVKLVIAKILKGRLLSLTTDHWTSSANQSYMALTAHWIDDDWNIHSSTLCCHHYPLTRETAPEIRRVVQDGWEKFDIEPSQIVAIVSDTAPNMNAAGILFAPISHHFCVAHVLELTTKLCFKNSGVDGIDVAMVSARGLVGYFNKSSQQEERLLEL